MTSSFQALCLQARACEKRERWWIGLKSPTKGYICSVLRPVHAHLLMRRMVSGGIKIDNFGILRDQVDDRKIWFMFCTGDSKHYIIQIIDKLDHLPSLSAEEHTSISSFKQSLTEIDK